MKLNIFTFLQCTEKGGTVLRDNIYMYVHSFALQPPLFLLRAGSALAMHI
jgi:hypothetical protein